MDIVLWVLIAVGGYVLGSVPTGLLARLWGVDLGKEGSGTYGATNAARSGRSLLGFAVLLGDVAKSLFPAFLIRSFLTEWHVLPWGVALLLGNLFSCFGFRGKGVAVSIGVFAAVVPELYPALVVAWAGVRLISRKMSASNLVATAFLVAFLWGYEYPLAYRILGTLACIAIFYAHSRGGGWGNIGRLWRRQESDDPLFPI